MLVVANAAPPTWLPADPDAVIALANGLRPPREWFFSLPPGFGPTSPPHVGPDGRVAAVAWPYGGVCHVGMTSEGSATCWTPTPSPTDNALFHIGTTVTAEGEPIRTGNLNWRGHDPALDSQRNVTVQESQRWYNDPNNARAVGRILETPEAAYFVGSLTPQATASDVATLLRSALSGDWRYDPTLDAYDALGPAVVARPGLPNSDLDNPNRRSTDDLFWEMVDEFHYSADAQRIIHSHAWKVPDMTTTNPSDVTIAGGACTCGQTTRVVMAQAEGLNVEEQLGSVMERLAAIESALAELTASDLDPGDLVDID